MTAIATATRRVRNTKGSYYLTHGGDTADHKAAKKAQRKLANAIIAEELDETIAPSMFEKTNETFRIVVQTQCYENYGTHCCDCESDESCTCQDHWKAKGGGEYQHPIGTANDVIALGAKGVQEIANKILATVDRSDRFFQEYGLGWEIVPSSEETGEERELREMFEWGILAPGAQTEAERTAYYQERLRKLRETVL